MTKIYPVLAIAAIVASPALSDDQTSPTAKLRYGYGYKFTHSFSNGTENRVALDRLQVSFTEQADFNAGENPDFPWTEEFSQQGFIINENMAETLISKASDSYSVKHYPKERGPENIVITYTTTFFTEIGGKWVNQAQNTHRQGYEITRCGDGVVDRYEDQSGEMIFEQCEPNDQSKLAWGSQGCSATCEALN